MSEPSSPDIVAELDAELALIEPLPYRVPIHILAKRARDEIVALRERVWLNDQRAMGTARAEERERVLAACEKIARDGAQLVASMSIKFVTPEQMASDLAEDIADNIAALRVERATE